MKGCYSMPTKKTIIIIFFCACSILLFIFFKSTYNDSASLMATGTVEITKLEVTPRLSGYIRNLSIDTGSRVKTTDILFEIERQDLTEQLKADRYALQQSEAKLQDLLNGPRPQEIKASSSVLNSNLAVLEVATTDLIRYRQLYEQRAISKQQLDLIQKNYDVALNNANNARAQLELLQEGARPEQITAQKAETEKLKAILAANKSVLADSILTSNLDGVVLSRNFENNEYVTAGSPVLTIANLQDCWIKVYIASNELGKIYLGQKVLVNVDSFPKESFQAIVKEISDKAEFTPRQSITKNERANMVFAVKVKLDNTDEKLKPGMPADVIFQ